MEDSTTTPAMNPTMGKQSEQLEKTPSPIITQNISAFSTPKTMPPQDAQTMAATVESNETTPAETSPGSRNSMVQHASPKLPSPSNRALPSQQVLFHPSQQQQPGRGLAYILSGPMPSQHQKPAQKTSPSSLSDASETTAVNPLHWLERKCDELVGGSAEASRGATKQFASERDGIPSSFKKPNTLHQLSNNHSNSISDVKGGTISMQNGTSGGIHHHPNETSSAGNRRLNGVSFTAQALQDAVSGAGGSQSSGSQKHQHIAQTGMKRSHPDLSTKGTPLHQTKSNQLPTALPHTGSIPIYNPALLAHQATTIGALQNPHLTIPSAAMAGSSGAIQFPSGFPNCFTPWLPMTATASQSNSVVPPMQLGSFPSSQNNNSMLQFIQQQQQQIAASTHLPSLNPFLAAALAFGLHPNAVPELFSGVAGTGGVQSGGACNTQSALNGATKLTNGAITANGTDEYRISSENLKQKEVSQDSINARLMAVASGQSPLVCMYKINDGQVCGMVFHHEDEIWAHYKSSHINQITSPTVTSTTNQHNQSGQRFPLTAAETIAARRQTTPTTTMTTSLTTPAGLAKVSSNGSLKQHSPTTGNRKQHPIFSNSHINGNLGAGGKTPKASKTEKHQNGTSTNRFHPYSASALTLEKQQNLPLATANSTPSTSSSLSSSTTVAQSTPVTENARALTTTASAPSDHLIQEQQQLQQLHLLAAIASGLGAAANPYSHPGMMAAAGGGGGGMPPPPPPSTMLPMMFPQIAAGMGSLGGVYGGGVPGIPPGMPSIMSPSPYNMPSPFGAFNIAALSAAAAAADPSQKPQQFPQVSKHPQPPQGIPTAPTQPPPPLLHHSQGASAQLDALAAMENKIAAG